MTDRLEELIAWTKRTDDGYMTIKHEIGPLLTELAAARTELAKAAEVVAIANRLKNVSRGYLADGSGELPPETTDDFVEEYVAELTLKLFGKLDSLPSQKGAE